MKIFKPYAIIPRIPLVFFLWLIFVVLLGMSGVLASIPYYYFDKAHILIWLTTVFNTGSLYSISIALSAASLFLVFVEIILHALGIREEDMKFLNLKVGAVAISFFLIILMAFAYSQLLSKQAICSNPSTATYSTDILQIALYIISLLLSLYILCISYLESDYENFQDIDDKKRIKLKNKAEKLNDDGTDTKL